MKQRENFVYESDFGTTTDIYMLPIGTKFWVVNGAWSGEIVENNGVKSVLVIATGDIREIKEDFDHRLVLNIKS